MGKKTGALIKQARLDAGLTQEKLAKKLGGGLTASDISKAERGEAELTTDTIKKIAKITGVTQVSLLGTSTAKKTTAKTTTARKTTATTTSVKLTATEKKLVEAYRKADSDRKKQALKILTGDDGDVLSSIGSNLVTELVGNLLGGK